MKYMKYNSQVREQIRSALFFFNIDNYTREKYRSDISHAHKLLGFFSTNIDIMID